MPMESCLQIQLHRMVFINASGEKQIIYQVGTKTKSVIYKNGYYAGATWIQGNDGNWYYINIGTYMEKPMMLHRMGIG